MTDKETKQRKLLQELEALENARKFIMTGDVFHKPFLSKRVKVTALFYTFRFELRGLVMVAFQNALDEAIAKCRKVLKELEQ